MPRLEEIPLTAIAIQARIDHCTQRAWDNPMQRLAWIDRAAQWQAILDQRTEDGYYHD